MAEVNPRLVDLGPEPRQLSSLHVVGALVDSSASDERRLATALAFAIKEAIRLHGQRAGTLRVIERKQGGPDGPAKIA
jgi:hypothetical protein